MPSATCSGLPAAWINAWLAAVGTTVLAEHVRLGWTEEATPAAVFCCEDRDPIREIAECWPDRDLLEELPLAETWRGHSGLDRKATWTVFRDRARMARPHPASWTLSSTMTDLCVDPKNGRVDHARFDPAGPGTTKWLHHRLMKAHAHVKQPSVDIADSLAGRGRRAPDNGLGFDFHRLGSLADDTRTWSDPVVEVLAFFGLALLPVRGPGRLGVVRSNQRGWEALPSRGSDGRAVRTEFFWPAWSQPLDRCGIDALLDVWAANGHKANLPLLGVHGAWRTRRYRGRSSNDPTRGFGSVRL